MSNEIEIRKLIELIMQKNNLGSIISVSRLNIGFNRLVYNVNNKYIIKICVNLSKENGIINEAKYFENEQSDFHPKVLQSDFTKKDVPFFYTIEEKINGENLFSVWGNLSKSEREQSLLQLIQILKKIHKIIKPKSSINNNVILDFNSYLNQVIQLDLLPQDKIEYLLLLKEIIGCYFEDAKFGYIHGDIHFNNIIYSSSGLKLIDFECYQCAPIDKEFDSLNRMVRNPNSLIKKGIQNFVNPDDYSDIMDFLRTNYSEVCLENNFDNRLIIYDCVNSLKWLLIYPNHQLYHDVLFEKSKRLIKK